VKEDGGAPETKTKPKY